MRSGPDCLGASQNSLYLLFSVETGSFQVIERPKEKLSGNEKVEKQKFRLYCSFLVEGEALR